MDRAIRHLKWILILESLFSGIYTALTRGLFVIFLVSLGYRVETISFVVFVSAAASVLFGALLFKRPSFMTSGVKGKVTGFHVLEKIAWLFIPLTSNSFLISALYSVHMVLSSLNNTFLTFIIYGSFSQDDIRDVTAKRSALAGVSTILGFALGVFLLALLPEGQKFIYIFSLGAFTGLVSSVPVVFSRLSHLEQTPLPGITEQPEKIFSTSSFLVLLLMSSNLLGIFWTPYLMNHLGGPDFLAASMNLFGTISSIVACFVWGKRALKTLRLGLALTALGPLLIMVTPWPTAHVALSVYTSFTFTAANFLSVMLFADYERWFGAVKSSVLLVILGNAAQLLAAPIGMVTKESYFAAFSITSSVRIASAILALVTVPEIAVIPEHVARTYSRILFGNSIMGYRLAVEISREAILMVLKILAVSLVLLMLYLVYNLFVRIMPEILSFAVTLSTGCLAC